MPSFNNEARPKANLIFHRLTKEGHRLPHKMSKLIAAGTSICGVTAITAVSPAIKANQQETSFAIANVVLFGTLGMLSYPYLANEIFSTSQQIGMFLGLAVHDTSQAIGSALTYSTVYGDDEVLKFAACLIFVLLKLLKLPGF